MRLSSNHSPYKKHLRLHSLLVAFVSLVLFSIPIGANAQNADSDQPHSSPTIHIVQAGESLFSIADYNGTTVDLILVANALDGVHDFSVGTRLVIPQGGTANTTESTIFQFADTFDQIAARHGVTRDALGLINHVVNPTLVFVGQELALPSTDSIVGFAPSSLQRIAIDQTLWQTAYALNVTPHEVIAINSLMNPYLMFGGQTIRMPESMGEEDILPEPWQAIDLHPLPLEPGRTSSLVVQTSRTGTVAGTFLGSDLRMIPVSDNRYVSLIGIYRWTAPGIYPLAITFTGDDGVETSVARLVQIAPGGYAQEIIRLSEEDAAVLADAETVQGEAGYIQQAMTGFSPTQLWNGLFRLPSSGIMSSAFGTARSYDGGNGFDTFHGGADLAAPTGTPIYAPAAGVVVDTASLSVRGYATILDHGWGVYSGFWHQSGILVEPGDIVAQGQQIGTVGNTGLSTAAHVHWEMWVTGVQVDPLEWVRQGFP